MASIRYRNNVIGGEGWQYEDGQAEAGSGSMPSSRGWGDGHADICSRASILQRARRKRILHAKHSPTNKEHAELRSKGVRSWRGVHENNVATAQTGARELISKGVRSSQNVAARQPPRRRRYPVASASGKVDCQD